MLWADPFPPYWENGSGGAIHYAPIQWPDDLQWNLYTLNGNPIIDQRDKDLSNGGTSPQGYVNVSSGCVDLQEPSIYWWFDQTSNVVCFRWRVEQVANTYAVGPKAGGFSSSDPWSSALWTVFLDIDGDGYREFAMFLNGSSGSPSEPVDIIVSVYSNTESQSIDWETAGIYRLYHNPTAYVDSKTSMILNFQSSLSPIASWPNGKIETSWDYGSTRAVLLDACGEYFIDYQIPLDMFDASNVGGPKLGITTPFSMLFSTANSLNNPLQKDLVYVGDLLGDPTKKASFGDMITLSTGPVVQPFIISIQAEGCYPVNILANIRDAFDCSSGTCVSSVNDVKFYGYFDTNTNGIPDDNNEWLLLCSGEHSDTIIEQWTATWDASTMPAGQYLIGAKGTDSDGNTTWSFISETVVSQLFGGHPNYANITPEPGIVYSIISNDCGGLQQHADLSIEKNVDIQEPDIQDTIVYTLLLTNNGPDTATKIRVKDLLPSGIILVATSSQTYTPISGEWVISELAPETQASLQLTATVSSSSEGLRITNTAQIVGLNETDSNMNNNLDSAVISVNQIPYADLGVQKTVSVSASKPGDPIQYHITLTNNGPMDANEIIIRDILPEDLIFIDSDPKSYTPSTGAWNIPFLAKGQYQTMIIFAQIIENPANNLIVNTASIKNLLEVDNNAINDSSSAQTSISSQDVSSDLVIEKISDKSIVLSGEIVCYTLSANNLGPDVVSDVYVIDLLSESLTYLNHTASQGNYLPYSNIWQVGTLNLNQTQTLTICTRLSSDVLDKQIRNSAQIFSSSANDPYLENNRSLCTITRAGLTFRPNHVKTTTSGSMIVFEHDMIIETGDQIGMLSFETTSSQNLSWSIFFDSNNNKELDSSDKLWTTPTSVSSMQGTFFIRTYIDNNIPPGFRDSTNVAANLVVLDKTITQGITDITNVIDRYEGDMHATKSVAIDSNCNTLLSDETPDNQLFETSKTIAPGECAIYRIYFINQGVGKLSKIDIKDYTPQYSQYIAGTAVVSSIPTGLTASEILAPSNNGTGLVQWLFEGNLLPGMAGSVSYEVKIEGLGANLEL